MDSKLSQRFYNPRVPDPTPTNSLLGDPSATQPTPELLVQPAEDTAEPPASVAPAPPPLVQTGNLSLLTSVTIRRFKKIEDLTISLTDAPTVLVGANNSGKSSVLHAMHFAVSVAQTAKLVGEGVSWRTDKFELSFNPTQLIWSPVGDAMSLAAGGILAEQSQRQIEIVLRDGAGQQTLVAVRRGRNRNIQVVIEGRALGERLQNLAGPFSVYTPGLAGVAREERFLSSGVVRRSVARGDANLVLRNVLLMLQRDQTKWGLFLQDMQELFPGIDFEIAFADDSDENIRSFVQFAGGPKLPLDAAGTAVLQAAQILGYSALYNPPLVLLDEPDSHLHPNNQRALCTLLRCLALERHFRLVVATHSRHVLDALRGASQVVWMSQGQRVPDVGETLTSRLLDLGALDSVDFFADGQVKCVVVSEDSNLRPLSALLWSNGFVESDTRIASYDGCSKVEAATVLGQFISGNTNQVEVVVHRDRDYLSATEASDYCTQIGNCDLNAFVTDPSDVEGYFVNATHLALLNPGITAAAVQAIIDEVTQQTRTQSVEAIVNIRLERAQRARARTGQQPNAGAIATQAAADFDQNPALFRRGKVVLGRVLARIQEVLGTNPRVFEASAHLVDTRLQAVSAAIWPPSN